MSGVSKSATTQNLLEHIIRNKIYSSRYWKEHCFGLNSESIIDRALELEFVGGTFGMSNQPSNFICLVLKLLQIQPQEEIIDEYLSSPEYKYLRALTAFYIRLTAKPVNVYKKLEPLYSDYRKLRVRNPDGGFVITHMDEFVDELITKPSVFDVTLPPIPKRKVLEINKEIGPRVSLLEADLNLELENDKNKDELIYKNEFTNKDEDNDYLNDVKINNNLEGDGEEDEGNDDDEKKEIKKRRIEYEMKKKEKV